MGQHFSVYPIFDVNVTALTLEDLLAEIRMAIYKQQHLAIGNVNIYALNLICDHHDLVDVFKSFDIIFCDGFGVKIGAAILGYHIPARFTPPDFIDDIMAILKKATSSVYLLGAEPGVAEKAAIKLQESTPGLDVAGCFHGFFNKDPGSEENESVVERINSANPGVLLVGFGMPLQEEWLAKNWDRLNANVVLTVGALFDTLSGNIPRAPRFITDHGFEWLARFLIEPKRLWKRYLIRNPLFFLRIFHQKLKRMFRGITQ